MENPNSTWLSLRGTWLTNILIAAVLKIAFSILPGVTPEISWTLTNLTYNIVKSFIYIILSYLILLFLLLNPSFLPVILLLFALAFGYPFRCQSKRVLRAHPLGTT